MNPQLQLPWIFITRLLRGIPDKSEASVSLHLNTRIAHHFCPACKLAADPFAQLLRRAAAGWLHADRLDVLAELGVCQRSFHLRVELVDDGRRRARGRDDSIPAVIGESR